MLPRAAFESSDWRRGWRRHKEVEGAAGDEELGRLRLDDERFAAPMSAQTTMKMMTAMPKPDMSALVIRASSPTGHGMPQSIHCVAASISSQMPSLLSSTTIASVK